MGGWVDGWVGCEEWRVGDKEGGRIGSARWGGEGGLGGDAGCVWMGVVCAGRVGCSEGWECVCEGRMAVGEGVGAGVSS